MQALTPLDRLRLLLYRIPGLPAASVWRMARLGNSEYRSWVAAVEARRRVDLGALIFTPLVSVLVPAYNTPERYLAALCDSVCAQRYEHWELILADASSDPASRERLASAARRDPRIRHVSVGENRGIAGNTNVALRAAKGEYVAFLDHDDVLAPDALAGVVTLLQGEPAARPEIIYSDEDKLTEDGWHRLLPFFKPEFDVELFHTSNYICHFAVVKRSVAEQIGGIRLGFDGAQDYDFLLRAFEATAAPIGRVPLIAYHWRTASGSTALHTGAKTLAVDAGRRALQDHLDRGGVAAQVRQTAPDAAVYRPRYGVPRPVRVFLLERGRSDLEPSELTAPRVELVRSQDDSEVTVVVEAGTRLEGGEWLEELALKTIQPGVAAVGMPARAGRAMLCIGYDRTPDGLAAHTYRPWLARRFAFDGMPLWPRTVAAVAPAVLATRSEYLNAFDPAAQALPELSLELARAHGGRVVCWSHAGIARIASAPSRLSADAGGLPTIVNPALVLGDGRMRLRRRP